MNAKISYTDETIEASVIQDFLPPPEKLAFREEGIKVTIALSCSAPHPVSAHDPESHRRLCGRLRQTVAIALQ